MNKQHIEILKNDREDLSIDINKLKEFMSLTENSTLPLYFKTSIKSIINSELQSLEFFYSEVSNDLNNVRVDVGTIDNGLTPTQEDYMIESGMERIREERENERAS